MICDSGRAAVSHVRHAGGVIRADVDAKTSLGVSGSPRFARAGRWLVLLKSTEPRQ